MPNYNQYVMPTNGYGSYYQQPQQNSYYNQQNYYQPIQHQQQIYLPLTYVNGIEQAKSFLVLPNQTIFLKDDENGVLYEKKTDSSGKASIIPFKLYPINLEEVGNSNIGKMENEYASKSDLKQLESIVIEQINSLSTLIKNALNNHSITDSSVEKGEIKNEQ